MGQGAGELLDDPAGDGECEQRVAASDDARQARQNNADGFG
jgi:hypothetical protein